MNVKEFVGTRVRVTFGDDSGVQGILRAVSPAGVVYLALEGAGGHETTFPLEGLQSVEDARFVCTKCGTKTNTSYLTDEGDARCADCYRAWAAEQPPRQEVCDCGAPAFYSPGARRFACMTCHGKAGTLSGLGVEARVIQAQAAPCRSADIHSSLHTWRKVRGNYLCESCHVKTHLRPASAPA